MTDSEGNAIARRVGPVYRIGQLTRFLPGVGGLPLTPEAVRKRAVRRQLVAYQTSDRIWVFPAWQFTVATGRLVPHDAVIGTWQALPHEGVLADVDLAVWMATGRKDLDGESPAAHAARYGFDEPLERAVRSLRRRAAA